jgi:hypothetical protein
MMSFLFGFSRLRFLFLRGVLSCLVFCKQESRRKGAPHLIPFFSCDGSGESTTATRHAKSLGEPIVHKTEKVWLGLGLVRVVVRVVVRVRIRSRD